MTKDDFEALKGYVDDFECKEEVVRNEVCMCAPGNSGGLCATQLYQSCYVNITNPPIYAGCNGTDSDYYLYSLGGYAPCFFYNFEKTYTFDFLIQCMVLTENDIVNSTLPQVGYQYRDVVEAATAPARNELLGASWTDSLTVYFNVRDMKYLSNSNQSVVTTTDADVMAGKKTMSVELNFNDLLTQDASGKTYFVVGGRTYYEATVVGTNTETFIAKGFFD